ncbi:UNVERIFIED_CONTAM: hypothetical protein RMT77_002621 [Armadillidium vulgare]
MDFTPNGTVYIGNLPHGLYEENLRKFLSQFGEITRLKVKRGDKNAKPMGYAYVEFLHRKVAIVVANTLNNYLMFTKLLKCRVIRGDSDKIFRKSDLKAEFCSGTKRKRRNQYKLENVSEEKVLKRVEKAKAKLSKALGLKIDPGFLIQNPKNEDSETKNAKEKLTKKFIPQKGKQTSEDKNPVAKRKQKLKKNSTDMKDITTPQKENNETPIYMDIEDEDDEISLKTPPNVIKRYKKSVKIGSLKKKIFDFNKDSKSIKEKGPSQSNDANQALETDSTKEKKASTRTKGKRNKLKPNFANKIGEKSLSKKRKVKADVRVTQSSDQSAEGESAKDVGKPLKLKRKADSMVDEQTDTSKKFKLKSKKIKVNANKRDNVIQSSDQRTERSFEKVEGKSVKLRRKSKSVKDKKTVMSKKFNLNKKIKKVRTPNSKVQAKLVSFKKKTAEI